MAKFLSGLTSPVIAKEITTGVAPIDFTSGDPDLGYGFAQSKDNPINITKTNNFELIQSTNGSNMASIYDRVKGQKDITTTISHNIRRNDFILLASMFFQNAYTYTPTITDNTISLITLNSTTATITVPDTGLLIQGDYVVISGSVDSDEDGKYAVGVVTGTTFEVLNVNPTFETTDISRVIDAELNTHTSMIEYHDPAEIDCSKRKLDTTNSIWLPRLWDKDDCGVGNGELLTNVIGKSMNIDFVASTYSIDIVAGDYEIQSTNMPTKTSQLIEPISFDGPMEREQPYVEIAGVEQDSTVALTLDITPTVIEDLKARKSGRLNKNLTDGILVEGSYQLLMLDQDEVDNHSYLIMSKADDIDNGLVMTFGLKDPDGSEILFTGKAMFNDPVITKELGGSTMTVPFNILIDPDQMNFEMSIKNGYSHSLESFFRNTL